uniref:type I protein arginine methyltransferase n=1 Tax=Lotharella oceanica TaxID=641309 RepID=A0A7S2U2X4_9EUKA|mmetsp:Transcript_5584/g.11077  ORF Transcript_5584/g.11077 Transcript_5584/m.11077 type:complete len:308 (+) Transcript_5584:234-1157(+)
MLKDEVRTQTYMRSIITNRHLFQGKTVLDIGCGTGILCMFAAKAGAKKVIGVECAEIYHKAKEIVAANGFADVITLVKGKVEEIELPVSSVDIIISEWMGYFLLYESMLDTVLYARDKWLAKGGAIFPDKATILISAIEDQEYRQSKIDYWKNVWSFDMSVVRELALMEPLVDTCDPNQLISDADKVLEIDIYKVTKEELDFKQPFQLKVSRDDFLHAFVVYFSVQFSRSHKSIGFSTGPLDKYTHWKQTVFYLDREIPVCRGDTITGTLSCARNTKNPRDLDIELTSKRESKRHGKSEQGRKYRLR